MKIVNTTYVCDLCGHEDKAGGYHCYTFTTEISIANADPAGQPYDLAPHLAKVYPAIKAGALSVPEVSVGPGYAGPIKMELCARCLEKVLAPILEKVRPKEMRRLAY